MALKNRRSAVKSATDTMPNAVKANITQHPPEKAHDRRHIFPTVSAFFMLLSGVGLAVASFVRSPDGEISDSVLWYVAQTLIYSGSIFGVSAYMQRKLDEIRSELLRR